MVGDHLPPVGQEPVGVVEHGPHGPVGEEGVLRGGAEAGREPLGAQRVRLGTELVRHLVGPVPIGEGGPRVVEHHQPDGDAGPEIPRFGAEEVVAAQGLDHEVAPRVLPPQAGITAGRVGAQRVRPLEARAEAEGAEAVHVLQAGGEGELAALAGGPVHRQRADLRAGQEQEAGVGLGGGVRPVLVVGVGGAAGDGGLVGAGRLGETPGPSRPGARRRSATGSRHQSQGPVGCGVGVSPGVGRGVGGGGSTAPPGAGGGGGAGAGAPEARGWPRDGGPGVARAHVADAVGLAAVGRGAGRARGRDVGGARAGEIGGEVLGGGELGIEVQRQPHQVGGLGQVVGVLAPERVGDEPLRRLAPEVDEDGARRPPGDGRVGHFLEVVAGRCVPGAPPHGVARLFEGGLERVAGGGHAAEGAHLPPAEDPDRDRHQGARDDHRQPHHAGPARSSTLARRGPVERGLGALHRGGVLHLGPERGARQRAGRAPVVRSCVPPAPGRRGEGAPGASAEGDGDVVGGESRRGRLERVGDDLARVHLFVDVGHDGRGEGGGGAAGLGRGDAADPAGQIGRQLVGEGALLRGAKLHRRRGSRGRESVDWRGDLLRVEAAGARAAAMRSRPKIARVLGALAGLLGEVDHDGGGERLGHVARAGDAAELERRRVGVLHEQRHRGVALEGRPAGEHLVEHGGDGVHVGGWAHRVPLGALGRDVLGGAEDEARLRRHAAVGPVEASDAEVEDLHVVRIVAAAHQHHVLGLDVAVDDALGVGLADGVADLEGDVQRAGQGEGRALAAGPGGHQRRQERGAVEVLHHQVELAARCGDRRSGAARRSSGPGPRWGGRGGSRPWPRGGSAA